MPIKIIAEAGVNHNGELSKARKLINIAADANVDFVKFQTFKVENVISKKATKTTYQMKNTSNSQTLYEMLKKLEFNKNEFQSLQKYCLEKEIKFLSTPHDIESVDFLNQLGIEYFKIASGDINNYPLLKKIGLLKKKVILSTGMSNLREIEEAINVLYKHGLSQNKIILLQCTSEYPSLIKDSNLMAMVKMKDFFRVKVGYSDHTLGYETSLAAVALGAEIIEKHYTFDKTSEGPDHLASLEPSELKEFVLKIRNVESALGTSKKKPSLSEKKNMKKVRKSIVASREIRVGEIFSESNLAVKRPGNGLSPMYWTEIIGKKSTKNYKSDDQIEKKS